MRHDRSLGQPHAVKQTTHGANLEAPSSPPPRSHLAEALAAPGRDRLIAINAPAKIV